MKVTSDAITLNTELFYQIKVQFCVYPCIVVEVDMGFIK